MRFWVTALGLALMLESLPYLVMPNQAKAWGLKMQEIPEKKLRTLGLVGLLIGFGVITWMTQFS